MNFIFATHNQHKIEEVSALLHHQNIVLKSLSEIGMHDEIIEDGTTMEENAWIKANYIYDRYGGNVIADDSGLEIDALDGAPGIYSARFAGPEKDSEENMNKVLNLLGRNEHRDAQFRAILAVWLNDKQYTFEGIVKGKIAFERSGTGGFGYDPIFIPDGYQKSFGVLQEEIKNHISHRARSIQSFIGILKKHKK